MRTFGALIGAIGPALVVIGWIYAGVPRDATEWLQCLELHGIALALAVIGAKLWMEAR